MKEIISFVILAAALTPLTGAYAAKGASEDSRPPLVLDSETGVHGGNGGTILESAPLPGEVRRPAAVMPPGNGSAATTYFVEPTIVFGTSGTAPVRPRVQPPRQPGSQPVPRPVPEREPRRDPGSGATYRPHPDVPDNGSRGDVPSRRSPTEVPAPRPRRELGSGAPTLPKLPQAPTPGMN